MPEWTGVGCLDITLEGDAGDQGLVDRVSRVLRLLLGSLTIIPNRSITLRIWKAWQW